MVVVPDESFRSGVVAVDDETHDVMASGGHVSLSHDHLHLQQGVEKCCT